MKKTATFSFAIDADMNAIFLAALKKVPSVTLVRTFGSNEIINFSIEYENENDLLTLGMETGLIIQQQKGVQQ